MLPLNSVYRCVYTYSVHPAAIPTHPASSGHIKEEACKRQLRCYHKNENQQMYTFLIQELGEGGAGLQPAGGKVMSVLTASKVSRSLTTLGKAQSKELTWSPLCLQSTGMNLPISLGFSSSPFETLFVQ